ncbi:putative leucine-rich repeat-containing protein DDB_G0290503 [Procambarus clarkii]|uniref:putative leucine-rich repeat-containing protein DDB_G0290503 n=1 Tax=Procambarus clarkii TaxID=6728 RepID=UPI0037421CAC
MEKNFLETAIAEKEREILDLNKQVDKFTTEIEKQKNIINNLEIENNKYEEELKTQIFNLDQLNECEYKIEEKDKQIKELDNRDIEKDKQLTEKDKQITELDKQIKQLNILTNSNNTEIKSKNVELNKNLQLCTTQLSEQKQEINRINEELTQSYRHINEKHQLEETYKNELEKCNYEKHELEKTYMKQLEEQKQAHQRQYEEELLSLKTKELEKHQQEEETYKQLQDQMLNKYNELLRQLQEPNYLAKILVDELASMDLVQEKIIEQLVDLYKYIKETNYEVIKKVSSQETTKTSKTYKTTDSGTRQKDAKQRSKLNTQDRRKNEILTLKKNQRGKQFMNRRGTDGKQLEEEVDINPINDTSSSVEDAFESDRFIDKLKGLVLNKVIKRKMKKKEKALRKLDSRKIKWPWSSDGDDDTKSGEEWEKQENVEERVFGQETTGTG